MSLAGGFDEPSLACRDCDPADRLSLADASRRRRTGRRAYCVDGAVGTGGHAGGTSDAGEMGDAARDTGRATDATSFSNACTNAKPLIEGADTGIYGCSEGYYHRAEAKQCPSKLPRSTPVELPTVPTTGVDAAVDAGGDAGQNLDECLRDSDCPGENAFCSVASNMPKTPCTYWSTPSTPHYWRACQTGCRVDADCAPNEVCFCGDDIGHCQAVSEVAGCHSDADCNSGLCLSNAQTSNLNASTFACQLPGDQCTSDKDCVTFSQFCKMGETGRSCSGASVCGRPFLVDHVARVAPAVRSGDWIETTQANCVDIPVDAEVSRLLTEHWTEIGLMEHASIAAFARFTLQLLSLGAPAELVADSSRAQADETRHARMSFELAATYGRTPVGPGRLDLGDALDDLTPETMLRTTIREGCVGETRAALEAAEAARQARVPAVKSTLEGIARDEGEHAALAWRVVRWILAERPELRAVAEEEFARASRTSGASLRRRVGVTARAHGMLDGAALERVHHAALDEVITPCAEALLGLPHAA